MVFAAAAAGGCTGRGHGNPEPRSARSPEGHDDRADAKAQACDDTPTPAKSSPGVADELRQAAPWIAALGDDADEVLLTPAQIDAQNVAHAAVPDAYTDPRGPELADSEAVTASLHERMTYLEGKVEAGAYVEGKPGVLTQAAAVIASADPVDELRIAADTEAIWCLPSRDGLYTPARDLAFDRNRCSTVHPGTAVRVLRKHADWYYVHAGHSVGWIHDPAWTPGLERDRVDAYLTPERRAVVLLDETPATPREGGEPLTLRLGSSFPMVTAPQSRAGLQIEVPTTEGITTASVPASAMHVGFPPLTRRRFLELAFSELDAPYGWGGHEGGRDCSRYVHDLFGAFGIQMARNSAVQAQLGTSRIELSDMNEAEKLAAIEAAHARGIVLLYMRGHIMIYLGQHGGEPYALSSLSEYLEPCPSDPTGGVDRVFRLDRVDVTTLELGRGTARTSFIERLERAVVFASPDT